MKTLRVAICILMIVGVLAMSLSVFADDPQPVPTPDQTILLNMNEELISYYIWLMMDAWGIEVSYADFDEYTDEINNLVTQWVYEYLETIPSAYSISTWIAPWQADMDYWGNYRFNNYMVEDVTDFVHWLNTKFGIQDNVTIPVSSGAVLVFSNGVKFYELNENTKYYFKARANGVLQEQFIVASTDWGNDKLYFTWETSPQGVDYYGYCFISLTRRTWRYKNGYLSASPNQLWSQSSITTDHNTYPWNRAGQVDITPWYSFWTDEFPYDEFVPLNPTEVYTPAQIKTALTGQYESESSDALIIAGDIELPPDNSDYSDGDGMILYPDGSVAYLVINWPDSINVDNLPAIITQGKIPDIGNDSENPGFSVPWQAINGLIQYVAAPAGAIMALVNEAPVEGVIMIYALLGGIIIFGMIRIMREH